MDRLKMKIDEIAVETFEISKEQEDALVHGAVRTLDPTKCEPHSCVPTSSTSTACSSTRCSAAADATSCPAECRPRR